MPDETNATAPTAQIPVNEAIENAPVQSGEQLIPAEPEIKSDPLPAETLIVETPAQEPIATPTDTAEETSETPVPYPIPASNFIQTLLIKARQAIQNRKRKKLDKIMNMFEQKSKNGSAAFSKITNDEVEKLLHVSDATATRYLDILEKENKITQSAKIGSKVSYTKI